MHNTLIEVKTDKLINLLDSKAIKIIDVRTVDAYNGWQLQNEVRGGHIKGAKSFPAKWLNYMDWIEMVHHKNILPDDQLLIYGYTKAETDKIANSFIKAGFNNVLVYYHFVDEWSANPDLPIQKLERYLHLVSAEWVKALLSGEKPAHYYNNKFVVVHAHYRNRDAYLSGHIPGAIDMDTLALEAPET